jgi:3D (Asp-Asp-Asp) domain-containing protein
VAIRRRSATAGWTAFSLFFASSVNACDIPSLWYDYSTGSGEFAIEDDFTGLLRGACGTPETLTAYAIPLGFHMDIQWNNVFGCSAATADMYFSTNCDIAIGTYTNIPNGTPQYNYELHRLPVYAYFSDQPYGSTIPADEVVDRHPTAGGMHNSRILTRIQLDILLLYQFGVWYPAPGRQVHLVSSRPNSDTITQPDELTDSSGWTTSWIQSKDNGPPNQRSSFEVDNGGIYTPGDYVTDWLPAKYNTPLLMTAYFAAKEADYATGALENRNGLPAGYYYHAAFLNAVKFQGSGEGLDGRRMHYVKAYIANNVNIPEAWILNGLDGAGCIIANGICAVDLITVAVDPLRVPFYSHLAHPDDTDGFALWYAHDGGDRITGLHLDRYFGFRKTDAEHYKVTHNLILSYY